MTYVVVGAGAVGGTVGGLLAHSGRDVVLLARGRHASALRDTGLRLGRPEGTLTLRVPVVERVADLRLRPDDVLLLTVKSQDSAGLLADLAALPVGAGTAGQLLPVLCLQNGVSNEREALRRFARVHGVCVMLPATHLQPGQVDASGGPRAGLLEVGRYPYGTDVVDTTVAADLGAAGFGVVPREDVMAWKRAKLLRNLGNALEALCGHDLDAPEHVVLGELDRKARTEGERCFSAAGLTRVGDEEWDVNRGDRCEVQAVEGRTRAGGSTWQSIARGAGSVEADHLNGEVVLLGRLHGVATPVNELLQREVNALVRDGRPAGSVLPSSLRGRLDADPGEGETW